MATGSSDGDLTTGPGALGGEPTPLSKTYIRRGEEMLLARGHRMHRVLSGNAVVKLSGGGAGVGRPEERNPEKVREDVVKEVISLERARKVYKVALDPLTLAVDWEETKALRAGSALK